MRISRTADMCSRVVLYPINSSYLSTSVNRSDLPTKKADNLIHNFVDRQIAPPDNKQVIFT